MLFCRSRGDWIRTSDPLHPMQVRYQTAPRPDCFRHTSCDGRVVIRVWWDVVKRLLRGFPKKSSHPVAREGDTFLGSREKRNAASPILTFVP